MSAGGGGPHPADIVARHTGAMIDQAAAAGIPVDVLARSLQHRVLELYGRTRSAADVAAELAFVAENLEDEEFPFARP